MSNPTFYLTQNNNLLRVTETRPPEDEIILASQNSSTISQLAACRKAPIESNAQLTLHHFVYPLAVSRGLSITTPPETSNLRRNKRYWLQ